MSEFSSNLIQYYIVCDCDSIIIVKLSGKIKTTYVCVWKYKSACLTLSNHVLPTCIQNRVSRELTNVYPVYLTKSILFALLWQVLYYCHYSYWLSADTVIDRASMRFIKPNVRFCYKFIHFGQFSISSCILITPRVFDVRFMFVWFADWDKLKIAGKLFYSWILMKFDIGVDL